MSNLRLINRTGFLPPPSVDEWLPQRHMARLVVGEVEGLDLAELEKSYRGSGSASASYHPAVLLGLVVYGYATRGFSSQALERVTYGSVAFRFIPGHEHPDHDTIAHFHKRFIQHIRTTRDDVARGLPTIRRSPRSDRGGTSGQQWMFSRQVRKYAAQTESS